MPERDFTTYSGTEVDPVYGPADAERPGDYPYTRGPYRDMYRSKLWTMRMFAGFGTPVDTNRRFKDLLAAGSDGLSTAFDLPTLMGRDSDDPLAHRRGGEVRSLDRHSRRRRGPLPRHRPRRGHDVDDDQLAGAGPARDVRGRGGELGRPARHSSAARCRTTS